MDFKAFLCQAIANPAQKTEIENHISLPCLAIQ
jgi:hypothetical protein